MLAAAICIPFILRQIGNSSFGVLTLVWALIGYFSLFDIGIGRALTYQIGAQLATGNRDALSGTVRAGVLLAAITGICGAGAMYFVSTTLVKNWLGIDIALQTDAILAFKITASGILFTTISSALRGALEGYGRFDSSNINKLASGIFTFILPAFSIYIHGNSISKIAIYLVVGRLLTTFGMIIQLKSCLRYTKSALRGPDFKRLLSYGIWVTVSGIVGPLMVYGDRFFVSATLGSSQLPFYAIPQEGLQRLLIIPAALCSALLPALSGLTIKEASIIYRINFDRVLKYSLVVCVFAALAAYPALYILFGVAFARAAILISIILTFGIFLNSIALVPYTFIHSQGMPRLTAIMHIFELAVYIVLIWYLTRKFGLVGAALAWVARVAIDLLLLSITVKFIQKK